MTSGVLTIIPTPLGNLSDITERAVESLKGADLIAAEDTRRTRGLLIHLGIEKPLVSYFEGNRYRRIPQLLSSLQEGKKIALVTSAGTPGISDPGAHLTAAAKEAGFPVQPLPGPSAVTLILSACGWPLDGFVFLGFLPRKKGKALREIKAAASLGKVVVLFESPYRILDTLERIEAACPKAEICLGREMTKIHEEFLTGTSGEVRAHLQANPGKVRGEITLAIRVKHGTKILRLAEDLE